MTRARFALVASLVITAACAGKVSTSDGGRDHGVFAGASGVAGAASVTFGGAATGAGANGNTNANGGSGAGTSIPPGHPDDDTCSDDKPCPPPVCTPCPDGTQACAMSTCSHGHCFGSGVSCAIETGTAGAPATDIVSALLGDTSCGACARAMTGTTPADDGSGVADCSTVVAGCGANDELCGSVAACVAQRAAQDGESLICAYYNCEEGTPPSRFFSCLNAKCQDECQLDASMCVFDD